MRHKIVALFIVALCLAATSCKKLDEVNKPTGPLTYETVKFSDAIPQEYGQLIGVTQHPTNVSWVGLWFQKTDGTITLVPVDTRDGKLGDRILKISRR